MNHSSPRYRRYVDQVSRNTDHRFWPDLNFWYLSKFYDPRRLSAEVASCRRPRERSPFLSPQMLPEAFRENATVRSDRSSLSYNLKRTPFGRGDDMVGDPHRAQIYQFLFLSKLILLLEFDRRFPVEQLEAALSQSAVPSPPS